MNALLKAAIAAIVLQWSLLVPAATAQEISANITQAGAGNLAGITQIDSDSVEARIAQTGSRNVANLGQEAAYITSAEITQRGNDNVAVAR